MKAYVLFALLAFAVVAPLSQSHALERSVPLPYDYSRSTNAGTYIPKCAVSETLVSNGSGYVCDGSLAKITACNLQKKFYGPTQAGADANGCVDGAAASTSATCGSYQEVVTTYQNIYGNGSGTGCKFTGYATNVSCPGATVNGTTLTCPSGYKAVQTGTGGACSWQYTCGSNAGSSCTPGSGSVPQRIFTCMKQ